MQICPECGTRNAAGAEFCSNCGTYLAWEDEQSPRPPATPAPPPAPETSRRPPPPRPERPAPPQPRPEPLPRPSPPSSDPVPGPGRGPTRHNPQKVGRMAADPDESDDRDDRTVVLPRIPDDVPGPGHWPSNPSPPDGTERAGSSSTVRGPGPVPPTKEPPALPPRNNPDRPPRPLEDERERSVAPGEVVCPRCGTGNSPERHFCRRCATELRRDAPRPVSSPSPTPRRGRSPLVWILVVLAALLVLSLLLPALFDRLQGLG